MVRHMRPVTVGSLPSKSRTAEDDAPGELLRYRSLFESSLETDATADLLRTLGADCLQGYHFGRPERCQART